MNDCSESVNVSSQSIHSNTGELSDYITDNMATTQQLAAGIESTNEIVVDMNEKVEHINTMLETVASLIQDVRIKARNCWTVPPISRRHQRSLMNPLW